MASATSRAFQWLAVFGLSAAAACAPLRVDLPGKSPDEERRIAAIRRADVWRPTDVASNDIAAGPRLPGRFAPNAAVRCNYSDEELSGRSPKFECVIPPDDSVKVKYGRNNGEVYAEVAATRLLWALGFGADAMYPVKVVCNGCPRDPKKDDTPIKGETTFSPAAIERKMPGTELKWADREGWSWSELDLIDERHASEQRAQRDALKLLAAMLQHSDSKPQQQRLVCLDSVRSRKDSASNEKEPASCERPFLMINDLGLTFGQSNTWNRNSPGSANFEKWSEQPVWRNAGSCEANLSGSFTGTLRNPVISEGGRKFLADLLQQLTDRQITSLFQIAGLPARARAAEQDSGDSVREWVAAFKAKRNDIVNHRCPVNQD